MAWHIFTVLLDVVVPPRKTERLLRSFTPEDALALMAAHGLPYHDPRVTALVWELKYYANPLAAARAAELLAPRVVELAAEELGRPLLVPVPMHRARRRERGHNQTEVLCRALLPHLGAAFEYAPQALARIRATPHQQGLERAKRLKNVQGSMQANTLVAGRVCVVVDDVTTTGATLTEAKRALHDAGARAVHTVALAYS